MQVDYIAQPDEVFGAIVHRLVEQEPPATRVVMVSAFVGLQTAMRYKYILSSLANAGASVRLVIGIDMGGTSKEVLSEMAGWTNVEVFIYKNKRPGHTFHPKITLVQTEERANLLVGSNNLTEGGFFRNYEAASWAVYQLPQDEALFNSAKDQLDRFLNPRPPLGTVLTQANVAQIIARRDIPSEAEAQERRRKAFAEARRSEHDEAEAPADVFVFGHEEIALPPPLPRDLLERLAAAVSRRRRDRRRPTQQPTAAAVDQPRATTGEPTDRLEQIAPASFYMTLPTLQGDKIPGEGRVPLAAIEMAEDFWGWPHKYTRATSPRGGDGRNYMNWTPKWRIIDAQTPGSPIVQDVRMYMYENSSDFRFYARPIVNTGADLDDLVKITRVDDGEADFECVIAKKATSEYTQWIPFCTYSVRNSTRRFGYG